ncbi:MAG TPA: AAA family ATPase [Casimicrobiaceae bacterium]|nr:AAA family ATPase [Casimicrobiaceae bacterium]
MERVLYEVKRVVVGQDHFLERVMVAMLAQGHLLVEGVPGLAKTLTVKTLAQTLRGTFKRIQFTPDLVPADLVGTRIFNPRTGEFSTSLGPVFTHLLLADEINRAPAKVQSALLEVMQERQVTIAGETHKVPEPFLVMATQNPIETEGTYPLPERILYEVKKVVVGQDAFLERVLVAILAQGHLLVEGVPGLAKTLTVKTLARTIRGTFRRIQFTPDLVPADLVGTRIYNQKTGEFATSLGPVFTNLLLADEINRAPAKVQSALLEVMQERQVTIAGESHRVPDPFLVMATQNPIETEGTYPLPEAQVDRFMMKVLVGYPNETEEFVIVERVTGTTQDVLPVATTDQLAALYRECRSGYVDPALMQYAVKLVAATREPERYGIKDIARYITFGASPRATIGLVEGARALAFLRGRTYALPEDMIDIAPDVLRHRLSLSYEALADGISADRLILEILRNVAAPDKPLETHVALERS